MRMIAPFQLIIPPDTWSDQVVSKEYPADKRLKITIADPRLIKTKEAFFSFQTFAGLDYFLELWAFSVNKSGSVSMKAERPFIALVVYLNVDKHLFSENIRKMGSKRYSLCYFPKGTYNMNLPKGDTVLAMIVPPIYFLHSMAIEHPVIKEMYNSLPFNSNKKILLDDLPLPQSMLRIVTILEYSKERGASLDYTIRVHMLQLLSFYNKQMRIAGNTVLRHIHPEKQKVGEIIKYIQDHLTDERLDETNKIAQNFRISITSMRKEFKDVTGKTIKHYIRDERLMYAKKLLEETDLPIGEIAFMVGYSSDSNFARAYRKIFGYAPGEEK